jgi:hypothetical protein
VQPLALNTSPFACDPHVSAVPLPVQIPVEVGTQRLTVLMLTVGEVAYHVAAHDGQGKSARRISSLALIVVTPKNIGAQGQRSKKSTKHLLLPE